MFPAPWEANTGPSDIPLSSDVAPEHQDSVSFFCPDEWHATDTG